MAKTITLFDHEFIEVAPCFYKAKERFVTDAAEAWFHSDESDCRTLLAEKYGDSMDKCIPLYLSEGSIGDESLIAYLEKNGASNIHIYAGLQYYGLVVGGVPVDVD